MTSHSTYFWRAVHDCLVQFHHLESVQAQRRVRQFRLRLQEAPEDVDTELIFHEEPFALACRLMGQEELFPSGEEAAQYQEILKRRADEAAALGTDEEVRRMVIAA
jgi:hypothetical protein